MRLKMSDDLHPISRPGHTIVQGVKEKNDLAAWLKVIYTESLGMALSIGNCNLSTLRATLCGFVHHWSICNSMKRVVEFHGVSREIQLLFTPQ